MPLGRKNSEGEKPKPVLTLDLGAGILAKYDG